MLKGRIFFWCLLVFCLIVCLVTFGMVMTTQWNSNFWKYVCIFFTIAFSFLLRWINYFGKNIYAFNERDKEIISNKITEFVKSSRCVSVETTKKVELLEIFSQKQLYKKCSKIRFYNTKDINFILKNTFTLTADSMIILEITQNNSVDFLKDKIVIKPIDGTKSTFDKIIIRKINN